LLPLRLLLTRFFLENSPKPKRDSIFFDMVYYNDFMKADKGKITFDVNGETFGKFKLREGTKRMKLYIKLNSEETQQWETLRNALSGGQMSNDTLARVMFFKGIHTITQELNERVENMSDKEKEEIMAKMSAQDVDDAMSLAEGEFAGEDQDENTSKDNN
tara:strand:- start:4267 stop:4746 length:480 start_codon:yes stop_codon:yes gene_type:complete